MTANINPESGIPYGYIKADAIDSDILDQLTFYNGKNLSYENAWQEYKAQKEREYEAMMEEKRIARREIDGGTLSEDDDPPFDEDEAKDEFNDVYIGEEEVYAGERLGVHYQTSWLGGAQHLYIFKSPVLTKCRPCSPCVPNAGDLDSVGDYLAYGVLVEWLDGRFLQEQCEKAGYKLHEPEMLRYCMVNEGGYTGPTFTSDTEALQHCYVTFLQEPVPNS